jgi:peptidyl-prolyl cis-trans isomerase D
MIEFIRKRLNSVFVLLLLGILIASFAFFGIGDVVQVGQGDTIAKVGDRRITVVELARTFENFVERQRAENPELTQAAAIRANVDTALLQRLVQQAVLIESAKQMGITASPLQTQAMVANLSSFQLAGKFDVATYKSALARLGISEDQLFEDMARQQITDQLNSVLTNAAHVPQALANAQIAALLETRTADALLVPLDGFEEQVNDPSPEQLAAFFETVSSTYNAPEYRDFSVVYLTPDAVAKDISVSEEDLLQAYEFRKDEFGSQAELDLQLVVFDTQEEADAFKAEAVNGARYLELAQATGASRDDISLGTLSRADIENLYGEDIAQALSQLNAGDVSEPLEGPFGFQVFRVAGKTAENIEAYDDVKEDLRKDVALQLALDRLSEIGNQIEDEFAAGATLEEAAKTFGLEVTAYKMVSDSGVTAAGTLAPLQANLQSILPDVFDAQVDNELEVQRLGEDGGYYITRLESITPTRPQTLAEVAQEIEQSWKDAEVDRIALQAADEIAQQVRGGAALQVIADEKGYELLSEVSFNRVQAQQGSLVEADLAPLLFSMNVGEVDVGRSGGGTAYVIAKLLRIDEGDSDVNRALANQLRTQLRSYVSEELLQQYVTGTAQTIETDVNGRSLETFRKRYDPTL